MKEQLIFVTRSDTKPGRIPITIRIAKTEQDKELARSFFCFGHVATTRAAAQVLLRSSTVTRAG